MEENTPQLFQLGYYSPYGRFFCLKEYSTQEAIPITLVITFYHNWQIILIGCLFLYLMQEMVIALQDRQNKVAQSSIFKGDFTYFTITKARGRDAWGKEIIKNPSLPNPLQSIDLWTGIVDLWQLISKENFLMLCLNTFFYYSKEWFGYCSYTDMVV